MYRSTFAAKTILLAVALLLAACTPIAEALAPHNASLPDDVARRVARLDALSQIKDGTDPATLRSARIARLDQLAQIKDTGAPLDEREARIARLDQLAQIKDQVNPAADRDALIARLDKLAQIKDQVIP